MLTKIMLGIDSTVYGHAFEYGWLQTDYLSHDDIHTLLSYLDKGEQERLSKLKIEKCRKQFIAAHGLLKAFCCDKYNLLPNSINLDYGEKGNKPKLNLNGITNAPDINLTHCDGLVGFILAQNCQVGIDAEHRNRPFPINFMDTILNDLEIRYIERYPDPDNFIRFWTLKEAAIKATGDGLNLDLKSVIVSLIDNSILQMPNMNAPEQNHVGQHLIDDSYILSYVVNKLEPRPAIKRKKPPI